MTAADHLLDAAERAPALLAGRCRAVALDGPAGSGKTTLADAVAVRALARGHQVLEVHMDDLYDGWRGVLTVGQQVRELLQSLHRTGAGRYPRYDWHLGRYTEQVEVGLPDVLVLEGVGCSPPDVDDLVALRVWVDAPRDVRLRRGLRRDGEHLREQWLTFLDDEEQVHARDHTRARADVVVDGVTGATTRDP